jgi:hypothetical protein
VRQDGDGQLSLQEFSALVEAVDSGSAEEVTTTCQFANGRTAQVTTH